MSDSTAQRHDVPPREAWPQPEPETAAGSALTDLILATFRLNGRLMDAAQAMAAEGDITLRGGRSSAGCSTSRAPSPRSGAGWG